MPGGGLSDPDSMTAQGNNLVFTSQADNMVITIHNPGPKQFVTVATVHDVSNNQFEVDDTIFTPRAKERSWSSITAGPSTKLPAPP